MWVGFFIILFNKKYYVVIIFELFIDLIVRSLIKIKVLLEFEECKLLLK